MKVRAQPNVVQRSFAAAKMLLRHGGLGVASPIEGLWNIGGSDDVGGWTVSGILPAANMPKQLSGVADPALRRRLRAGLNTPKKIDGAIFRNGRFFQPSLATMDQANRLLYDYSFGWTDLVAGNNGVFALSRLPPIYHLKGRALVLDTRGHAGNYFHWLIEAAPRMAWVEAITGALSQVDHYILGLTDSKYVRDTLGRLGFEDRKWIDSRRYPHLQADELIVFSDTREFVHPETARRLQEWFLSREKVAGPSPRAIYVSRGPKSSRQALNEAEAVAFFETEGVSVVEMDDLSVSEQANLFHGAEVVIAHHGAALANLVFCKQGTRVLEIFPPLYQKPIYWAAAETLGLSYHAVTGLPPGGETTESASSLHCSAPFSLDMEAIRVAWKSVCEGL
ncbi:MAG: glycosyltransferase family 61 protein [Opitutales bacterium]|nr:glycosyltransferase family 61 protein [Opitutales bacterium]